MIEPAADEIGKLGGTAAKRLASFCRTMEQIDAERQALTGGLPAVVLSPRVCTLNFRRIDRLLDPLGNFGISRRGAFAFFHGVDGRVGHLDNVRSDLADYRDPDRRCRCW